MKKEKVSIVIPVYNASLFLNDTIKTIQNQTYDDWEAIFVNELNELKKYNRINKKGVMRDD